MLEYKLQSYSDYSFTASMSGADYTLNFRWNDAKEYWCMTVGDSENVALVQDVKMVFNIDLFQDWRGLGLPTGSLLLYNPSGDSEQPTFDNISEFALIYDDE